MDHCPDASYILKPLLLFISCLSLLCLLPSHPPPSSRPYARVHVCLHAHARAGSPSCTHRQALTQTVTHNDSQSSHIRTESKVHRIWRAHGRPQVLNDDAPGHTAAWFCFLRPSPAHPRNCSVSFSSPHSRLVFF